VPYAEPASSFVYMNAVRGDSEEPQRSSIEILLVSTAADNDVMRPVDKVC